MADDILTPRVQKMQALEKKHLQNLEICDLAFENQALRDLCKQQATEVFKQQIQDILLEYNF